MKIGYSTGSLALGDFRRALSFLRNKNINAVELSALRETEITILLESIDDLNLNQFEYISFHAPSKLKIFTEEEIVELLVPILNRQWPIIVHPDIIQKPHIWHKLGKYLCIENMDKRKMVGSTANDLRQLFFDLPDASLCLDLAHVKQIDPTMNEAYKMVETFKDRIMQLHVSEVNSESIHERLNLGAIQAFRKISNILPSGIPIILESPVEPDKIESEKLLAESIFDNQTAVVEIS